MPEVTKPEDATTGAATTAAAETPKAEATKAPEKLDLTQDQFDTILADRIKRAQPKDYADLQAKAAELDTLKEAAKTDAQKATDEQKEKDRKSAAKLVLADARLLAAAIINEAAKQNAVNPGTVVKLLAGDDSITVADDGEVSGVEAAVKKLLKDEPYLVKGVTKTSGGEFGGADQTTLAEKISAAEAAGDYKLATTLKVQQGLNIS